MDVGFDDLGSKRVKNIADPVRTYRVRTGGTAARPAAPAARPVPLSIAVLPFNNMSGVPTQDYSSDGITEDILTDLSKISALFVIARNSSFTFKGKAVDIKQVAAELGVAYVLEGSVRRAADRIRVTAQLIDGATARHLWAERYDRVLDDVFAIQDEITLRIVGALKVTLDLEEQRRLGGAETGNMEAHDLMLRGREQLCQQTATANAKAIELFEKAIELDGAFIPSYWGLAVAKFNAHDNGWKQDSLDTGIALAKRAIEFDPADPMATGLWLSAICGSAISRRQSMRSK